MAARERRGGEGRRGSGAIAAGIVDGGGTAALVTRAVLFDMDGTLVDSGNAVHRTWAKWAARHGLDADRIVHVAQGRRSSDTIRTLMPPERVAEETAWLDAVELQDMDGTREIPGARAVIDALPTGSWAIVTSASRDLCEARLRAAGLPIPEHVITSELVARGKPAPDGYQLAATRLGRAAGECLVAEDAPAGIKAGIAAGMQVLGIISTHQAHELVGCVAVRHDWRGVRVAVAGDAITLHLEG